MVKTVGYESFSSLPDDMGVLKKQISLEWLNLEIKSYKIRLLLNSTDKVTKPKYKDISINMAMKIASLNLCHGLKFKKDLVKNIMKEKELKVLCMQEVEVENGFNETLLRIPGFNLELEKNLVKARVAIYINLGRFMGMDRFSIMMR